MTGRLVLVPERVAHWAATAPQRTAVHVGAESVDYGSLDRLAGRAAAALRRDGLQAGDAVAICSANSLAYLAVFLAAMRCGLAISHLPTGLPQPAIAGMLADAGALRVFFDDMGAGAAACLPTGDAIALDRLEQWLEPPGVSSVQAEVDPEWTCNLIYSSGTTGTTGTTKGIVQSYGMRSRHIQRMLAMPDPLGPAAVAMLCTPIYSNTTLANLFAGLAGGAPLILAALQCRAVPRPRRAASGDARHHGVGSVRARARLRAVQQTRPIFFPLEAVHGCAPFS